MPDKKTTQTKRTTSVKSKSQPSAPQSEIVRDPAADATQDKPAPPIGDYRGS